MKKVLIGLLLLIAIIIGIVLIFFSRDAQDPYNDIMWGRFSGSCQENEVPTEDYGKDYVSCDLSIDPQVIPTFSEVDLPFSNEFDNTRSLPLNASCLIDVDGDGIDEVFIAGGVEQEDALFQFRENKFVNISTEVILPPKKPGTTTYGAVSFDLDNDGGNDLVLTGEDGLHWYRNLNGKFVDEKIEVILNEKSTAATVTIGDYDNDGDADIFLCAYIRLDKMEGQTIFKDFEYGASSLLLQNNGDQTFENVTADANLTYVHNTFQAVFVDVDSDGFLDLVVAHDTGEVRTYKNKDGRTFQLMPNPITGKYAYPMGIAVGDYNNDGRVDFFFSNTGSSVPAFLARGDLAQEDEFIGEWILLRNDGDFKFTDVAVETKVSDFEFSWGAIFQDFNLDGLQDLVVAENYVDFPPHKLFKLPCRFLLQLPNGTFAAVEEQAGLTNKNYGITPLTSDFNGDGYPDLLYINLNGPHRAFINNGGDNNYIGVRFPETASYAGALVQIETANGKKMSEVYVIGEGLGSDQTNVLTFGLGEEEVVKRISIQLPSGAIKTLESPGINKVLDFRF